MERLRREQKIGGEYVLGNIFVKIIDMPCKIKGHVNENQDGSYTVFLNARLTFEQQQETYMHEIRHILNDDFAKEDTDLVERRTHERICDTEKEQQSLLPCYI